MTRSLLTALVLLPTLCAAQDAAPDFSAEGVGPEAVEKATKEVLGLIAEATGK